MNKKNNKKILAIIVLVIVVAACCLIYFLCKNDSGKKAGDKSGKSEVAVDEKDGNVKDYEKSGNVTLSDYKDVYVDITPTKEEIDTDIESDLQKIDWKKRTQYVCMGDYVYLDYELFVDGATSDDLSEEGICIKVGDYVLVRGFEDSLLGKPIGKKSEFKVFFPNDYDNENLAGKNVLVKANIYAKFSDELAAQLSKGKFNTVEKYRKNTEKKVKKNNLELIGDSTWEDIAEKSKVSKYPEGLISEETKTLEKQYKSMAKLSGSTYEELLASFGMDEESLDELARSDVKDRLLAKTIASKENIKLDEKAYMEFLMTAQEYTKKDKKTLAELEKEYIENVSNRPKDDAILDIVKKFVGTKAKH